ncbi:MAG: hypothetical protein ACYS1A_17940 [Planctomycetota bacterium]|jgi:hypothetical protein
MTIATPKTYQKYRNRIRTGDLIQFESTDFISRIISWRTKSKITHSAMAFWLIGPTGKDRLYILEGVAFGLFPTYLSNRIAWYLPHGNMYWHKTRPKYRTAATEAADTLLDYVGTYYDYKDLILQAIKRVTLNPSKLFCSEAVLLAWADIVGWPMDKPVPYPGQMPTDYLGVY